MSTEPKADAPQLPQPDGLLQALVQMVNTSDFELGMTVQVSGLLVSGVLVSRKSYTEGIAETFVSAFKVAEDPESARLIKKAFTPPDADADKDPSPLPPTRYIHMRDAHFFGAPGQPIPKKGVWWRGRLSEVGGFTLGTLSLQEDA